MFPKMKIDAPTGWPDPEHAPELECCRGVRRCNVAATVTDFSAEREAMIDRQLSRRGIAEPMILDAFLEVPREEFVSPEYAHLAYGDHPLPIEAGQTISQPYIVALMIQAAGIGLRDKVLEVGAGSGYAAAIISRIAGQVIAIERQHDLVEVARVRLVRLGFDNVKIIEGDGTKGCPEEAPFDAIVAAASGSHVPEPWLDQVADEGRIVMPVGSPGGIQELIKVTKRADGTVERQNLGGVRFVPLIGEEGWRDA
jgi:protein-L-isoaspartate(D-aspartate) O-methyltransferase